MVSGSLLQISQVLWMTKTNSTREAMVGSLFDYGKHLPFEQRQMEVHGDRLHGVRIRSALRSPPEGMRYNKVHRRRVRFCLDGSHAKPGRGQFPVYH